MKAWVSGGTGFVGSHVVAEFGRRGHDVFVPTHSFTPADRARYRHGRVDLLDAAAARTSIEAEAPDVIVHSAILNDYPAMMADRQLGWDSYVGTTQTLARLAAERGCGFVVVSTDWVFDGTQAGASEHTPPNPINLYGVLKMSSELVALEAAPQTAVARVAGVNGTHLARPDTPRAQDLGFGYFVLSLVDALRAGQPFTVWDDPNINNIATPSLASESATQIVDLAEQQLAGTFHCVGGEAVDRVTLGRRAAEAFGLNPALVQTGEPDWGVMAGIPIPYDTSLDASATADAIGRPLLDLDTILNRFRTELEQQQ